MKLSYFKEATKAIQKKELENFCNTTERYRGFYFYVSRSGCGQAVYAARSINGRQFSIYIGVTPEKQYKLKIDNKVEGYKLLKKLILEKEEENG